MPIDPNDRRYLANRSLWRKVSPYSRQKPQKITLLDRRTNEEYTLDKTRIIRDRAYYEIGNNDGFSSSFVFPSGEYEEGLIVFSDENINGVTFITPFTSTPYLVLYLDPNVNDNVAVTAVYKSNVEFFLATSANYTGNIYYKAVYSPSYPTQVTSPSSGSLLVVAGGISSTGDGTVGQSAFAETKVVGQTPIVQDFYVSPVFTGNFFTDPITSLVSAVESNVVSAGLNVSVSVETSAPLSSLNEIDYLIVL